MLKSWVLAACAAVVSAAVSNVAFADRGDHNFNDDTRPDYDQIHTVVVIYAENRSFDSFFGKFPGANGFASAGGFAPQIGPDGRPYKYLPAAIDSNLKHANLRVTPGADHDRRDATVCASKWVTEAVDDKGSRRVTILQ